MSPILFLIVMVTMVTIVMSEEESRERERSISQVMESKKNEDAAVGKTINLGVFTTLYYKVLETILFLPAMIFFFMPYMISDAHYLIV